MDIHRTDSDMDPADGITMVAVGYRGNSQMREFREGIFRTLRGLIGTSLGRAFVYTIGHIIIAMTCNRLITGADWALAGADAIIEPLINGVWYYVLDRTWASRAKA
jgi:uncharacterized membrane protein